MLPWTHMAAMGFKLRVCGVLGALVCAWVGGCAGASPPTSTVLPQRFSQGFAGRYANVSLNLREPTLWSQLGGSAASDKLSSTVALRIERATLRVQLMEDETVTAERRLPFELRNGALVVADRVPFSATKGLVRVVGVQRAVLWREADQDLLVVRDTTGATLLTAVPVTTGHRRRLTRAYTRLAP